MNKEEILKRSQKENQGKLDEREQFAYGNASKVGMLVGGILCVLLVLVSDIFFNQPELALAGWMMYFAMQGSSNVVLYRELKEKGKLIYGISELLFSFAFMVALIVIFTRG